ncbi:MAG: ABC transporter ATP-binding protein/permease [Bacillales bacterium]|jgi:ATP-binding cassette subfamily B protein|nr:ABC transporter ATP-binding protein/permease [Bacillales bacterium]
MPPINKSSRTSIKANDFKGSFKKLVVFLKPLYKYLIVGLIFSVLSVVIIIIGPSKIGIITDVISKRIQTYSSEHFIGFDAEFKPLIDWSTFALTAGDWKQINDVAIFLVIMYVASYIFGVIRSFVSNQLSQATAYRFRKMLIEKINRTPIKYFDDNSYGDTLSRITNDVDNISGLLSQAVDTVVLNISILIGYVIMMLGISWELTLIAIASVPLAGLTMAIIMKRSQKYFAANQRVLGELNGHIEEIYSGLNIIKVFDAQERFETQFNKFNTDLANNGFKSNFFSIVIWPITNFINNLVYIGVCLLGGVLVFKGRRTLGELQSMIIYASNINRPIAQVAQISTNIQMLIASAERIFIFLGEKELEKENVQFELDPHQVQGNVKFEHVKFSYNEDREIIKDFSVEVKSGQKIAIVGPTGAGKTTLVNLLMRFYEINSGHIYVDGVDTHLMSRSNVQQLFGMVLQDTWLFKGTIEENLTFGRKTPISHEDVVRACKAAHVHHFIKSLSGGYKMIIDEENQISSGQKQLLTIARAMIVGSPMLILDEATSNVDTRTEQLIQDAMDELMKNRTSFVIAHRLSTIRNSDLILVMNNGDIIESGTHNELLDKNGFYAKLYNSQFEGKSLEEAI